jgi:hypothetical protein
LATRDKFGHPIALAIVRAGIRQVWESWTLASVRIDQTSKGRPKSVSLLAIESSLSFCWNTRITTRTTDENARTIESVLLADEMENISQVAFDVTKRVTDS